MQGSENEHEEDNVNHHMRMMRLAMSQQESLGPLSTIQEEC